MDLSARRGPTAGQYRDRRADRTARHREQRMGLPADPGRTAQARPPGQRLHHPPGPQDPEDPASAEAAHRHHMAQVPAHPGSHDARHRLLPRGLRGHPPAAVLPVRHGGRLPLRAHPRHYREPGRAMDHPADPQPADGPRRSRRRLPVPGPGPRRSVHRSVRRGPDQGWYHGRENPASEPARELLCGTVRAHRPDRGHRPDADLRRTASAHNPRRVRGPLQRATTPSQPPAPPAEARSPCRGPLPPADQAPTRPGRVPCQNSRRASDLGFYPRHSCSPASPICS